MKPEPSIPPFGNLSKRKSSSLMFRAVESKALNPSISMSQIQPEEIATVAIPGKADTLEGAWEKMHKFKGQPHGWIQWKGTEVCMDVHCKCGHISHIDSDFVYAVKCPKCGTSYACNGHIQFIELAQEPRAVKLADE